ncbi:MAG: Mu transposase C-terminal domain-containing protein [Deltaproteobacteria bacterium]|nr:Mu transposase C-terminal domain-containing protein [Deltaproteobacteria bacterium]
MNDILFTVNDISNLLNVSKQAIVKRAGKESWTYRNGNGKGGTHRLYSLHVLPADIQQAYVARNEVPRDMLPVMAPAIQTAYIEQVVSSGNEKKLGALMDIVPALSPRAILAFQSHQLPVASFNNNKTSTIAAWNDETAISEKDLRDSRTRRILEILREAEAVPSGWKKRAWIESVALRYDVTFQSIYRWIKKYEKKGIAGIRHTKSSKGKPRAWDPEAVDHWIGLCLKREHRKIDHRTLYHDCLVVEAARRGWQIGSYESALWWYEKRVTPQLLAMQKGGIRALDNLLPPVLRSYADLAPFEMLVGDQHRFDFWVVDEDTGEIFRPEGYFWQDLRTRIIYGGAVDKKYDAWLIGLALKIGVSIFGAFGSIYTDNGKPELSRYLMGIMADMATLGLSWSRTTEAPVNTDDADDDEINPLMIVPGTHKKAIVKNAKAKMIEGTFDVVENILRSKFKLPGNVKRLTDDIHHQDVDQNEIKALAEQGKLPTFSEFTVALYQALDYYNREKAHRGVLKEWAWKPKPKTATPYDCLMQCYRSGWRPRYVSPHAVSLIFLKKTSRTVQMGRVQFEGDWYEHDALIGLHKQAVDIRHDPTEPSGLLIFKDGSYLCTAMPVTYSSMKDMDLARRKIMEKRERRKLFAEQFKRITSNIPDIRQYSEVPQIEKDAARYAIEKQQRTEAERELFRERTPEELAQEVRTLEMKGSLPARTKRPLPERPTYFLDEISRYEWCVQFEIAGGTLSDEDEEWKQKYEASMSDAKREYWQMVREYGGV